jgi:hypothetical protein
VPELKPDHLAVLKPVQFLKQIADLLLQLGLLVGHCLRPVALAAQARDSHNSHIAIKNWLADTNRHILNPAELVLLHQFHEAPLSRAQILSPQGRSERWGRL